MVSIEVSKTYEIVTHESASQGMPSDHGYCFSPMFLHLKDMLHEIELLGSFDLSAFSEHIDLYGHAEDINYRSCETTTYHLRIKASPRAIKRIVKLIQNNQ